MSKDTSKNVKWIDGLRGVASFTVVCTHLSRAFDYGLFMPRDHADTPIHIAQYPIIRILFQGKFGVIIFALLTGYVCALKPIKLARSGKHSDGLSAIAKSAFRRPPRLILPATIAMVIAWALAQCGGFVTATRADSDWLRYASPVLRPTSWDECKRLFFNFWSVWTTNGHMDYDDHQWTLLPLLKGSMIVFVLLAALIYAKFRYRMMVYVGFLCYWWQDANPFTETFGFQCVYGVLLSDLALHPQFQFSLSHHKQLFTILSIPLMFGGLFIASYPDAHPEWAPWSLFLHTYVSPIFPSRVPDLFPRFSALGVDMLAFGITLNGPTKAMLSNRFFLWLGKNSFAVYLIHGTLLRSVLTWMLFSLTGQPWHPTRNEDGEEVLPPWIPQRAHGVAFFAIIAVWFVILYCCAHLWTAYVDAWCGTATKWLENKVFLADGEVEGEEFSEKGSRSATATGPLLG